MALSNWAICAWDEKGRMSNGSFQFGKVTIELYKNWAYLRDEKAWTKKSGYTKPTISTIEVADIDYKGITIYAKRGLLNSIYLIVNYHYWGKPDKTLYGIGSYAYDYKGSHVGIRKSVFNSFVKWIKELNKKESVAVVEPKNPMWFNQGDYFLGSDLNKFSYSIGKIGDKSVLEKAISRIK